MSWLKAMQEDALAVALESVPDWQIEEFGTYTEGDEITLNVDFEEGYAYSEYTWDSSHMKISVSVYRNDQCVFSAYYTDDEATEFFQKLMSRGYSE